MAAAAAAAAAVKPESPSTEDAKKKSATLGDELEKFSLPLCRRPDTDYGGFDLGFELISALEKAGFSTWSQFMTITPQTIVSLKYTRDAWLWLCREVARYFNHRNPSAELTNAFTAYVFMAHVRRCRDNAIKARVAEANAAVEKGDRRHYTDDPIVKAYAEAVAAKYTREGSDIDGAATALAEMGWASIGDRVYYKAGNTMITVAGVLYFGVNATEEDGGGFYYMTDLYVSTVRLKTVAQRIRHTLTPTAPSNNSLLVAALKQI